MSMFKTIQNYPGIITIYHNAQSSLSKTLLSKLQQSNKPYHQQKTTKDQSIWDRIINGNADAENKSPQEKYTIEEIKSGFPTYDQLKLIKSFVNTHPSSKDTFIEVFPRFINERAAMDAVAARSIKKINISDIKIPEEDETLILIQQGNDYLLQNNWFRPPLIVDWDNSLIANNESTLDRILKHYSAENHSNGD